ncbi:MAG: hypothetical protein OEM49_00245 [Myxococcales bacterium]|nr:hypothetical protein [Myxococcales bacterium]MDH5306908.1 hypothetical protein [Myxococcales bacterium]MDH5565113.1 hypothetical protein [Myxococcales bacterium]
MKQSHAALAQLASNTLFRPASEAASRVCEEIRSRHGDALVAVLFYGSCLRGESSEGVLDFYALVDDYVRAYDARWPAWLNAAFPPSVFYLECDAGSQRLRAKVAVISVRDFLRGVGARSVRSGIWARFCQPSVAVWVRDAAAREALVAAVVRAALTAVERTLPQLPDARGMQRFDATSFWQASFRETYAAELRAESDTTIQNLYHTAPEYYARLLEAALESLAGERRIALRRDGALWIVEHPLRRLRRARTIARLRRPAAKLLALIQLLKSACTFGDWLPYALWKLERHTGTRLVLTERQRRHPWLFGWPLILRVLRRGELR